MGKNRKPAHKQRGYKRIPLVGRTQTGEEIIILHDPECEFILHQGPDCSCRAVTKAKGRKGNGG